MNHPCRIDHNLILAKELVESFQFSISQALYKVLSEKLTTNANESYMHIMTEFLMFFKVDDDDKRN